MYLRKMGSVSLLTREGEVEIAKRIEDGERRVLQVVLNSSVAIEEILQLGDKLRSRRSASRRSSRTRTRKTPSSTSSGTSTASAR
jgi:RNA polymerase primary sigma factor